VARRDSDAGGAGVERAPKASLIALMALALIAVLAPWPFGSAHPVAEKAVSAVVLASSSLVLALQAARGAVVPNLPGWPFLGLLAIGVLQLIPLPAALHALVAPASHQLWHPAAPAAAVLGDGPRPISVHPEATLRWLALTTGLIVLAWGGAPAAADRRRAQCVVAVVVAGGTVLAAYGIVARALFGPLLYGHFAVPTISPFGPFVSKNHFAGYMAMVAMLTLGLAAGLADRERRTGGGLEWTGGPRAGRILLTYGAALAMLLALLVSLSRGGLISVAVGAVALGSLRLAVRRHAPTWRLHTLALAIAALVAAGLVAVLPPEARQRIASLASATAERSGSFRLDTWRDALRAAAACPILGQGLGAFADAFPRYKRGGGELRVEHAENDYLEALVEAGLPALGMALFGGVLVVRSAVREQRQNRDRLQRGLVLGALSALAALAVHSAVDFNMRIPSNAALAALMLALVLGGAGVRPQNGGRWRWAGAGTLALLLVLRLLAPLDQPPPEDAMRRAAMAVGSGRELRLAAVEAELTARLRRRPGDAESWALLSWTRRAGGNAEEATALERHAAALDPSRFAASPH
jgi:O-antigen ligase